MARMRSMRAMKAGNWRYQMPEESREAMSEADLDDDEDGYPWDPDLGWGLEDEDDEGEDE